MAVNVTAYEFFGDPTGDPNTVSLQRSTIADLSQKSITDPTQIYYGYDIQRLLYGSGANFMSNSMKRYVTFRITGTYQKIKNIKLTLYKPGLYKKVSGVSTLVSGDDSQLCYKLTTNYEKPQASSPNIFGETAGAFDGSLSVVADSTVVLRPKLSTVSPALATTRQVEYSHASSYWTEFLVLQNNVFPGSFNQVGNFGKTGGNNLGGITGPLLTIEIDEVGSVVVN